MTQEQDKASIRIAPEDSYLVKGFIPITNNDRRELNPPEFYELCRCGSSGNKSFCDGTHWGNGFTDG